VERLKSQATAESLRRNRMGGVVIFEDFTDEEVLRAPAV
jgi:hypothetical protein